AKEHVVITVKTSTLLERHEQRVLLSPINSGSTIYKPVQRGLETFAPLEAYPYDERRRIRGVANAVAELAVEYSVPDLRDFVERVERRRGIQILDVLFPKKGDHRNA